MGRIKDFLNRKVFTIFSTGKAFDPYYQDRSDAMEDLLDKTKKKDKEMLDKMFVPVRKKKKK